MSRKSELKDLLNVRRQARRDRKTAKKALDTTRQGVHPVTPHPYLRLRQAPRTKPTYQVGKDNLLSEFWRGCACIMVLLGFTTPSDVLKTFKGIYDEIVRDYHNFARAIVPTRDKTNESLMKPKTVRLKSAPGYKLLKIADFFFSRKTVALTFTPLIADWHSEYFEALNENRRWKARWISGRYLWAFAKAFGLSKLFDVLKSFIGSTRK